jgi:hypothetical protein
MSAEDSSDLRFDRAQYDPASGQGAATCGACKGPLGDEYWKCRGQVVCRSCRDALSATLANSQTGKSMGRAVLMGGLTALGCGVAYAVFVAVTKYQLALLTIGIGILVANAVRKASHGVGGTRFQVLAVVLTYLATTMGYFPAVWRGATEGAEHTNSQAANSESPGGESRTDDAASSHKASLGDVVVAVGVLLAFSLAAPFFAKDVLGLLIVGFGLFEAWRRSRAFPLVIEGPFRVAPQATGPPGA